MPTNALTIFDSGAMPAHIAMANEDQNIVARASVNSLTFEGKTWAISIDGKKTKLLRTNADGEEEPVSIFTGILLDYTKVRGREYYPGIYDPKKPAIPVCWSDDSVTPAADVTERQAKACADCPMSKKGSKISDDGKISSMACGSTKKLAIVPTAKLGSFPPLRLKLKITSLYDKNGAEKNAATGWYAFDQYIDLLVSKGVRHTALLPTKIKFDTSVAYPKLLFSPGKDWLTAEQLNIVKPMAASDEVKDLLNSSYTPATGTGTKPLPVDDEEEVEVAAAAPPQQARAAKAPVTIEHDEDEQPVTPKVVKAALVVEADEDDEEAAAAAALAAVRARKAKAAAEAAAVAEAPDAEATAKAARATAKKVAADAAKIAQDKAAATAATAKAASVAADEDEEETAMPPAKAAAKSAAAAKGGAKGAVVQAPLAAPPEIAEMIAEWDE
jgi:hypothetical protein